jgi:hypothetical protein
VAGVELNADVPREGERGFEVCQYPLKSRGVDGWCAAANVKAAKSCAGKAGGIQVDFLVDSRLVTGKEALVVFDPVVGAIGAEILAKRYMQVQAGMLETRRSGRDDWLRLST